jgi:transposase-like protein
MKPHIIKTAMLFEFQTVNRNPHQRVTVSVDLDCAEFVIHRKWRALWQNGKLVAIQQTSADNGDGGKYLHRLLTGADKNEEVDHIDGNPANNRRANLRKCSHRMNGKNRKVNDNNTTGFTGVHRGKGNVWIAQIKIDQKPIHLGSFGTPEEAAGARITAELEFFGEYSRIAQEL